VGFVLAGAAQLEAAFGQDAADALNDPGRVHRNYMQEHQVPWVAPLIVPDGDGTGIVLPNDQMGPMTGFYWSLRRMVAQGYSAGTVAVYRNASQTAWGEGAGQLTGELLYTFPSAGTYTFGRREMMLSPDDTIALIVTGATLNAGVTGIQVTGAADQFPSWYLPRYGS
jgi:hypothetical protein